MFFITSTTPEAPATHLPYAQASAAQRAQLLAFVSQRLRPHFPTLSPAAWLRILFEFQPTLLVGTDAVTLARAELTQLVQYVATSPELPPLDPPIYSLPTLELAQRWLRGQELAASTLGEVVAGPRAPQLTPLFTYLCQPCPLAEQIVQAWRWNLASSPALPPGIPGGKPTPDVQQVQRLLEQLRRPT